MVEQSKRWKQTNKREKKVSQKRKRSLGRGGGCQVVSVFAFYSDDPCSNPAEVYNFWVKLLLKRTKINKKRPELVDYLFKKEKEMCKGPIYIWRDDCCWAVDASRVSEWSNRRKNGRSSLRYFITGNKVQQFSADSAFDLIPSSV